MSVARGKVGLFFVAGGVGCVGVCDGYSEEFWIGVFGWIFFGAGGMSSLVWWVYFVGGAAMGG